MSNLALRLPSRAKSRVWFERAVVALRPLLEPVDEHGVSRKRRTALSMEDLSESDRTHLLRAILHLHDQRLMTSAHMAMFCAVLAHGTPVGVPGIDHVLLCGPHPQEPAKLSVFAVVYRVMGRVCILPVRESGPALGRRRLPTAARLGRRLRRAKRLRERDPLDANRAIDAQLTCVYPAHFLVDRVLAKHAALEALSVHLPAERLPESVLEAMTLAPAVELREAVSYGAVSL
jgi:hypothetical protein